VAKYGTLFRTIFFIPFAVPAWWARDVVVPAEPSSARSSTWLTALGFGGTDYFSSNLHPPTSSVIVIWDDRLQHVICTPRWVGTADVIEAAILDDTPALEDHPEVKLRWSPGHRAAGVHQHDRPRCSVHRAADPASTSRPGHPRSTSRDPVLYNTAIAGGQYNLAAAAAVILGVVIVIIRSARCSSPPQE